MLTVLLGASCDLMSNRSVFVVVVGAQGRLSDLLGPCDTSTAEGPVRFWSDGRYEALSPGDASITCRDGTIELHARSPARLTLTPVPTARENSRLVYGVTVHDDAGNELDLGEDTSLTWTFSGSLVVRDYPGCGDVVPICPARHNGFARATTAGTGDVEVTFGGLRATTTTLVTPR